MLAPKGFFAVEMGFGQAQAVAALFQEHSFQTHVKNDLAGIPRICSGSRP
jgi:methylase of polypeptide subunit release factors